jgi:hypothetical protein
MTVHGSETLDSVYLAAVERIRAKWSQEG